MRISKPSDHIQGVPTNRDAAAVKSLEAAEEFESMFLHGLLKSMRRTVQENSLLDGGQANDLYKELLDGEYARIMASTRSTGIAEAIERQIIDLTSIAKDRHDSLQEINSSGLRTVDKRAKIAYGMTPATKRS